MRNFQPTGIDDINSVDLVDPATHANTDLTDFWRFVRARAPVYRHPGTARHPGFWVVSRHSDIVAAYRDKRLTSERGNVLVTLLDGADTAAGKMLAVTDGGRHKELRAVLQKAFSPGVMSLLAERLTQLTHQRIAQATAMTECDFAQDVASQLPMTTICELLGVPRSDWPQLMRLNKSALAAEDPAETDIDSWSARNEILLYFSELVDDRREKPQDDVIGVLTEATINGERLTHDEIIFNCYSLILGGDETSRLSMSGAVHAFAEHPEQWLALRDGTADVATAVEEVLRWTTPAIHFGRVATADVTIDDNLIRNGEVVTLWNCSANRDEEAFIEPYAFDLTRSPNKHVTFGHGAHFCLGAYLARIELKALLLALRAQVDHLELAGPVERIQSNVLSGISRLPVAMKPATTRAARR